MTDTLPKEIDKIINYDNFNRVKYVEYPRKEGGRYTIYVEYGNCGYLERETGWLRRMKCRLAIHDSLSWISPICIHCGNRFYWGYPE